MFLLIVIFISFDVIFGQNCPVLLTNFNQLNCTSQSSESVSYYYYVDNSTCLPECKEFESAYPKCSTDTKYCPPAYSCEQRCSGIISNRQTKCTTNDDCAALKRSTCQWFCVANDDSCMAYHASTEDYIQTYWTAEKFKPTCDNNGNWVAKQCKGGLSGRCLCYDNSGKRLFGQALATEADDMTCACSRKKAELIAAGRKFVGFHCQSNGNYEKLQCDSELCWCAEPKTGDPISPVVPEKAMTKLPCYSASEVGAQYFRQCDSKKFAIGMITKKLQAHGVKYIPFDRLLCDDDGSYGSYSVSSGIAYCTWRDNTKIGTWQANTQADFSGLNCNCARDYKMYSHTQDCEGNGNYKVLQQIITNEGTFYYCVDDDGFAKSGLLTEKDTNCTNYY